VYLVVNKTICSFTGSEVRPLKILTKGIHSWYGASYYHRGTLYCSSWVGGVFSYEIGSLSNRRIKEMCYFVESAVPVLARHAKFD
jgi:hypothetical protein